MASSSAVTITAHPRSAAASGPTLTTVPHGASPRPKRTGAEPPEEADASTLGTRGRRGPAARGPAARHARRTRTRTRPRATAGHARRGAWREGRLHGARERALGRARTTRRARGTERRGQLGVATNLGLSHDEDPLEAETELRLTLPLPESRQQQGLIGRRSGVSRS